MQLSAQQRGVLGSYTKRPETIDPAVLRDMADTLLKTEKKRGRRPAGFTSWLTERQLRERRRKEIPLGDNVHRLTATPDGSGMFKIVNAK